jgi:hypothetical protein
MSFTPTRPTCPRPNSAISSPKSIRFRVSNSLQSLLNQTVEHGSDQYCSRNANGHDSLGTLSHPPFPIHPNTEQTDRYTSSQSTIHHSYSHSCHCAPLLFRLIPCLPSSSLFCLILPDDSIEPATLYLPRLVAGVMKKAYDSLMLTLRESSISTNHQRSTQRGSEGTTDPEPQQL